jgi:hypothetical protein
MRLIAILARARLVPIKIRLDIGAFLAARLANEPLLKIG